MPPHIRPLTLSVSLLAACVTTDDPSESADTTATETETADTASDDCLDAAEQLTCPPPQGKLFTSGTAVEPLTLVLPDDPDAALELPDGWLVQVSTPTEFIGTHYFSGDDCQVRCSYCEPGQSLCHADRDAEGLPAGCMVCLPFDTPDAADQCATFLTACGG